MSEAFAFTPANKALAEKIIARYPAGRQASAVLPLLDLAQRQANDGVGGVHHDRRQVRVDQRAKERLADSGHH